MTTIELRYRKKSNGWRRDKRKKKMEWNEQKREREARFNEFDKEEMKEITKSVCFTKKTIRNNAECMGKYMYLQETGKYVA
jgi:hypothetical protein